MATPTAEDVASGEDVEVEGGGAFIDDDFGLDSAQSQRLKEEAEKIRQQELLIEKEVSALIGRVIRKAKFYTFFVLRLIASNKRRGEPRLRPRPP